MILFSSLSAYIDQAGIVIYPLVICCLWMWWLILFHLPLRRRGKREIISRFHDRFSARRTGHAKRDRRIFTLMLDRLGEKMMQPCQMISILTMTAPLLGLLGTVTGMINTFDTMSRFGLGNPKALAGGISEAMITTQFGLIVSVPGMLFVHYFKRRVVRVLGDIAHHTPTVLRVKEERP